MFGIFPFQDQIQTIVHSPGTEQPQSDLMATDQLHSNSWSKAACTLMLMRQGQAPPFVWLLLPLPLPLSVQRTDWQPSSHKLDTLTFRPRLPNNAQCFFFYLDWKSLETLKGKKLRMDRGWFFLFFIATSIFRQSCNISHVWFRSYSWWDCFFFVF